MPAMFEAVDSRRYVTGENPGIDLIYILTGVSDDMQALTLVANSTPETYQGFSRRTIELDPEWVDTVAGDGRWKVTVRYGLIETAFSFDTGGGTQHVTQSLQTVEAKAIPGKTPPNFKGAIGVTNQSVEGVDIVIPVYNWSETHHLASSVVTQDYRRKLFQLTGKVNSAYFKGHDPGECLFRGARGAKRSTTDWEISFTFAGSPNRTNLQVGDITGIDKKGWQYLWVLYDDAEDTDAKRLVKRPAAAYVEKVYESGDFADLGIGT